MKYMPASEDLSVQRIFSKEYSGTSPNQFCKIDSILFESSPDCVKLLDLNGNILEVNRNGLQAMEIEHPACVTGFSWTTLWPEPSHQAVRTAVESAAAGLTSRFHGFCPTSKGTPKWWDVVVTPIHGANGRMERLMSMSRDVTAAHQANEEVQASRERFALLLQSSGEGIYGIGQDNRCTFINRTGAGVLGYEPEELIGRQLHHLIHHHRADGSCYPADECRLVEAVANGLTIRIEDEVFWRKDGTSVAVSYSVAPMINNGVQAGAVVTFTDVTQRRHTERALQASEERLRLATDAAELGLWTWNQASDVVTWENSRPYEILGLPSSAGAVNAAGFVARFLHAEDVGAFERAVSALDAGGRLLFQGRVRRTDGSIRWVEFSGRRQSESKEGRSVVVGTIADISERKHAELDFYASRQRLEKILSQAAAGVVQADANGQITLANRKYCEMLGYAETELIGASIIEMTAPDSVQKTHDAIRGLVAGGPGFTIDKQYRRKDGSLMWATSSVNALRSQDGHYLGMVAIVVDISERIRAEQALRQSENQLRSVLDSIPQKIFTTTSTGHVNYVNPAWTEFAKAPLEKLRDWGWTEFVHPDDVDENVRLWEQAIQDSAPFEFTHRFLNGDGTYRWHLSRASPLRDEAGRITMWVGSNTDIHDLKLAEESLRAQTEKVRLATEAAQLGMFDNDVVTGSINWNDKAYEQFGVAPGSKVTRDILFDRIHADDRERMRKLITHLWSEPGDGRYRAEYRVQTAEGKVRWISASGQTYYDASGRPVRMVGTTMDVSERKESERKIQEASQHDSLTGLPNRALLYEYCSHILAMSKRHGDLGALLFIDLDRFKPINDMYGHDVGDKVLQQVAQRLLDCTRKEDIVSRLGGDEFIVVLPRINSREVSTVIARNILSAIAQPMQINSLQLQVSPSIGISLFPDHASELELLIRCADMAMYAAKRNGRNNVEVYSAGLSDQANSLLRLEILLKHALETDRLALHYQPILEVESRELIGVEALIRIPSEDGTLLGPTEFIPVAEAAGLMNRIGEWVVRKACRQHRLWREAGLPAITIAVNVSPTQFHRTDFVSMLEDAFNEFDIDPAYLQLEVTEGTVMHDVPETIATLKRLQAVGVKIALDDFGTGYSSLSHLSNLPLDKLKIDQSFIKNMVSSQNGRSITEAIIALGQTLNLKIVGEGVESEGSMQLLRDYGCNQAQGFLFSKPLPADEFARWHRNHLAN